MGPHANMLWSGECLMISCCRRMKAFAPSPYIVGMWIPKRPMREYARSSMRVVCLPAAHDMRRAMLMRPKGVSCRSTGASTPVILSRRSARSYFVPSVCQWRERNRTETGAMSSWRVHPRVNHLLPEKEVSDEMHCAGAGDCDTAI